MRDLLRGRTSQPLNELGGAFILLIASMNSLVLASINLRFNDDDDDDGDG